MSILSIEDLSIDFKSMEGGLRAVDGASFSIAPGRTTALVGESGSGKTVISQAIMYAPWKETGGGYAKVQAMEAGSEDPFWEVLDALELVSQSKDVRWRLRLLRRREMP